MGFGISFRFSTGQWKECKQINKKKEDSLLELDSFLELLISEYHQCKNKIFYKTFLCCFCYPFLLLATWQAFFVIADMIF